MADIRRQYFLCDTDKDNSEMINRFCDHDGQIMKWSCKILDQSFVEESKKLIPFEKAFFYFYVESNKLLVYYENTGKYKRFVVCVYDRVNVLCCFDKFYDLLRWLYSDKVEKDLSCYLLDLNMCK